MALSLTRYRVEVELMTDLLGTVPKNKDVYATFIQGKARELIEKNAAKGIPLTSGDPVEDGRVQALMEEERETVTDIEERGWTGFHTIPDPSGKKDENGKPLEVPILYDYAIKGFLKESARTLKEYDPDEAEGGGQPDESAEGEEPAESEDPRAQAQETVAAAQEERYGTTKATKEAKVKKPKAEKKAKSNVIKQLQDKVSRYVFVSPRKIILPPVSGHLERPLRALTALGPRVTVVRSDKVPEGSRFSFDIVVLKGAGITAPLLKDILEYAQWQGFGQWRSGGYGRSSVVSFRQF